MLCTIYNTDRHLKYCLQEINWITNDQYYQYIVDPGRLFQSRTIRIVKEYLYGLHFAGFTYSLYGWLARVELHLVNSKRSSKFSLFMLKTIFSSIQLKKETVYVFRVQATSVFFLNDLRIQSHHVFAREQAERLFAEFFITLAHLQPHMVFRPEQHIQ